MNLPRGISNCNPGNIRYDGTKWNGLTGNDGTFCIFVTPVKGIRAIAKILNSYSAAGIRTVSQIINRWAPPSENDTASYIKSVCESTGLEPTDEVTQSDYAPLIEAIIKHENGQQPYTRDKIVSGIMSAM